MRIASYTNGVVGCFSAKVLLVFLFLHSHIISFCFCFSSIFNGNKLFNSFNRCTNFFFFYFLCFRSFAGYVQNTELEWTMENGTSISAYDGRRRTFSDDSTETYFIVVIIISIIIITTSLPSTTLLMIKLKHQNDRLFDSSEQRTVHT